MWEKESGSESAIEYVNVCCEFVVTKVIQACMWRMAEHVYEQQLYLTVHTKITHIFDFNNISNNHQMQFTFTVPLSIPDMCTAWKQDFEFIFLTRSLFVIVQHSPIHQSIKPNLYSCILFLLNSSEIGNSCSLWQHRNRESVPWKWPVERSCVDYQTFYEFIERITSSSSSKSGKRREAKTKHQWHKYQQREKLSQ